MRSAEQNILEQVFFKSKKFELKSKRAPEDQVLTVGPKVINPFKYKDHGNIKFLAAWHPPSGLSP